MLEDKRRLRTDISSRKGRNPRPSLPGAARLPIIGDERMSAVDQAWLKMDQPNNPMIVAAMMELDQVRAPKRLVRLMLARLLQHPRFRQRADTTHRPAAWIDDGELHLGYHLHLDRRARLRGEALLPQLIGEELSRGLDPALPLWRITVYPLPKHRLALLFQAHHAIADGVGQLRLLLQLSDHADARRPVSGPVVDPDPQGLLPPVAGAVASAHGWLERMGFGLRARAAHPSRLPGYVRRGVETAQAVVRVILAPRQAPELLGRPLTGRRRVGWHAGVALARVHELARRQNATINDVFLAALAGATRRYLCEEGHAVAVDVEMTLSIPVNLRPDDDDSTGNSFGLLLFPLPIGPAEHMARLAEISHRMAALKRSPEARVVLAGLAAVGHLPPATEKRIVNWIGDKAGAVVSNLPGPRRHLRLGGGRLARIVFWPPQTGQIGLGVSLLSYAGEITIGVTADSGLLSQPEKLAAYIGEELATMHRQSCANTPPRRALGASTMAPG